jgi:hypothetical protein
MTGIVEKLRTRNGRPDGFGIGPVCDEAADEIERLQAEVLTLHKSLAECVLHAEQGWARYENANLLSMSLQVDLERLGKDAERWRKWEQGAALTFEIPTPTPEKPNRKITVIYGPNPEPAYAESIRAAIDAMPCGQHMRQMRRGWGK